MTPHWSLKLPKILIIPSPATSYICPVGRILTLQFKSIHPVTSTRTGNTILGLTCREMETVHLSSRPTSAPCGHSSDRVLEKSPSLSYLLPSKPQIPQSIQRKTFEYFPKTILPFWSMDLHLHGLLRILPLFDDKNFPDPRSSNPLMPVAPLTPTRLPLNTTLFIVFPFFKLEIFPCKPWEISDLRLPHPPIRQPS